MAAPSRSCPGEESSPSGSSAGLLAATRRARWDLEGCPCPDTPLADAAGCMSAASRHKRASSSFKLIVSLRRRRRSRGGRGRMASLMPWGGDYYDPFSWDVWDPFDIGFGWEPNAGRRGRRRGEGAVAVDWRETPDTHMFRVDVPGKWRLLLTLRRC